MSSLIKAVLAVFVSAAILAGCGQSTEQDRNKQSKQSNEITAEQMETVMEWWDTQPTGICALTDDALIDFAGGLAAGTVLTAHLAADTVYATMTLFGPMLVSAPAVAGVLVFAGSTAVVTYVGLKAYCMGQSAMSIGR